MYTNLQNMKGKPPDSQGEDDEHVSTQTSRPCARTHTHMHTREYRREAAFQRDEERLRLARRELVQREEELHR